jgi:hypothetical protein
LKAINFYTSNYHSHLVCRKKSCTIRLGDKTHKYAEGDIVWVTVGQRFAQKKKIYTAVIDRVLVKPINQLDLDDIQGENPDMASADELQNFLETIYEKALAPSDTVTVIYFSEIIE